MLKKIKNAAVAILLSVGLVASTFANDVYVVANKTGTQKEKLDYDMVEDIFTNRTRGIEPGVPTKIFVLSRDSALTRKFAIKYLGMTASRFHDILEGRESSGRGNTFRVMSSEVEVVIKVLATVGSIGYASDMVLMNVDNNLYIIK